MSRHEFQGEEKEEEEMVADTKPQVRWEHVLPHRVGVI
jgi:hypothetical protein